MKPRRQPTTRDYQNLWQHYSQGTHLQNPEHLTSFVGLKALVDGQAQTTVEQMFLVGSPRTQTLLVNYSMAQIKKAVTAKVHYLTVMAEAEREVRQASAQEMAYYQHCYQQQWPKYQAMSPLERDSRIAQIGFKPDRSNLSSVVQVVCQSPQMQGLEPDAALEHLASVMETASQRHREARQALLRTEQRQQRENSQGFEMG